MTPDVATAYSCWHANHAQPRSGLSLHGAEQVVRRPHDLGKTAQANMYMHVHVCAACPRDARRTTLWAAARCRKILLPTYFLLARPHAIPHHSGTTSDVALLLRPCGGGSVAAPATLLLDNNLEAGSAGCAGMSVGLPWVGTCVRATHPGMGLSAAR